MTAPVDVPTMRLIGDETGWLLERGPVIGARLEPLAFVGGVETGSDEDPGDAGATTAGWPLSFA